MIAISESILVESKTARDDQLTDVSNDRAKESLNKAKALIHFTQVGSDDLATTEQMAEFYEIPKGTVKTAFRNNRDEFLLDGTRTFTGQELRDVRAMIALANQTRQVTLWTPRGALRLGMLLRDSEVAKAIRTVLLNEVEQPGQLGDQVLGQHELQQQHQNEIERLRMELELVRSQQALLDDRREIITNHSLELAGFMLGADWREVEKVVDRECELGHTAFEGGQHDLPDRYQSSKQCRLLLTFMFINAGTYVEDRFLEFKSKTLNNILYTLKKFPDGMSVKQYDTFIGHRIRPDSESYFQMLAKLGLVDYANGYVNERIYYSKKDWPFRPNPHSYNF